MDDPKEPPPMVFGELSQPLPGRRLSNAVLESGPTGSIYVPEDSGGHNGTTGPAGPLTLRSLNGPTGPSESGSAEIVLRGVFTEGRAAGEGSASAVGATVSEAVGSTGLSADGGAYSISGGNAGGGVTTTVRIGRAAIANRDAILVQAMSVELLLRGAIDREKAARSNSGSLPELDAILEAVNELRAMLLTTTAATPEIGAKALSFKDDLINWWNEDSASILDRGFNAGLFVGGLILCQHFGMVSAVTVAAALHGKEFTEAIKAVAEVLKNLRPGD
jgi:hypothetical protein